MWLEKKKEEFSQALRIVEIKQYMNEKKRDIDNSSQ